MALIGMEIVRRYFGRRNGLAPVGCEPFDTAAPDFHDKAAAMPIELNCEEIDPVGAQPPKVRERPAESGRAQCRNEVILQCDINFIARRQGTPNYK